MTSSAVIGGYIHPPLFKIVFWTGMAGDWESLGMVHLEIPAHELQPSIPFQLDLFERTAYVTLVFFTMRGMRVTRGPRILTWLLYPFREQRFLNARTYVRHNGERGIHFIREWISDPFCVHLGPLRYGLPYHYGKHDFRMGERRFAANVSDRVTGSASSNSPNRFTDASREAVTNFSSSATPLSTRTAERRGHFAFRMNHGNKAVPKRR